MNKTENNGRPSKNAGLCVVTFAKWLLRWQSWFHRGFILQTFTDYQLTRLVFLHLGISIPFQGNRFKFP